MSVISPHVLAEAGRRAAKRCIQRYLIEGESVTWKDIAARIGTTVNTAQQRWRAARKLAGPVTWERLRK
jgi:hypothetical protein